MNYSSFSNVSAKVDSLAILLLSVSALLVFAVFFALVYFCIKYRVGSKASRAGRKEKSTSLEVLWSGLLLLFGLTVFYRGAKIFFEMYSAPKDAMDVYVVGKQWMWIFQYPGGISEIGTLKVPQGKPMRLLLLSSDVIHSFFVPDFRIKQDVLPGKYTSLSFTAQTIGRYPIFCSEYCGLSHSEMRGIIEVLSREDFALYQKSQGTIATNGTALYKKFDCASCHESGGKLAPNLHGIFGKKVLLDNGHAIFADENYLRSSLLTPNKDIVAGYKPLMPTYLGLLNEADLNTLVQYLKGLQ